MKYNEVLAQQTDFYFRAYINQINPVDKLSSSIWYYQILYPKFRKSVRIKLKQCSKIKQNLYKPRTRWNIRIFK